MPLDQTPIRQVNWGASATQAAESSYERLAAARTAAAQLRDSGFIWIHERTHLDEIIERVDATVRLKRERDENARQRNSAG
jgi:hypothetical protein